jgi:VIT1/CCC1 family predicted Fe2+/Mn2+ transporter
VNQLNRIKGSKNDAESREIFRENFPPILVHLMEDTEIDRLNTRLKDLPELSLKNTLILKDFLNAGQIFLLVFLITLPVALPFLFFSDVAFAMRISNGIALLLLFLGGFSLGRYAGIKPFLTALAYAAIGVFLVAMTMALGG